MADVDDRLPSTAEDIGSGIERNLARLPFSDRARQLRRDRADPRLFCLPRTAHPDHLTARRSRPQLRVRPSEPIVAESGEPSGRTTFVSTSLNGDEIRAVHLPCHRHRRNGVRWYIGSVIVGERLTTMHETLASLRQVLLVDVRSGSRPRPRRRLGAGRTSPAARGPRHRRRRRDRRRRWDGDLPQRAPPGAADGRRALPPLRDVQRHARPPAGVVSGPRTLRRRCVT